MSGLEALHSGEIGYFYRADGDPGSLEAQAPEPGYMRSEGPWVTIDVLDDSDPYQSTGRELTEALVVKTPTYCGVVHEVVSETRSTVFGSRASSGRYTARTVIGGIELGSASSLLPIQMQAKFHGLDKWTGLVSLQEDFTNDVAAGIEYFVRSSRPAQWAHGTNLGQQLGNRVGSHFASWVGDTKAWGQSVVRLEQPS